MVTITIEEEGVFHKTHFPDKIQLYKYLWDKILAEKLAESENSGEDGPFSPEEAMEFLDNLMTWNK